MTQLALVLISLYQRFLSPYKGFSCAYRLHRGGASCSCFGHRAIARKGISTGIQLLRRRFQKCGKIHRQALARLSPHQIRRQRLRSQSGYCDLPVGGCDLPSGGCDISGDHSGLFDACSMIDCGNPCDLFNLSDDRRKRSDYPPE